MKKQLLLYLFIVAVLMNIFTYMYFTKKEESLAKHGGSGTATTASGNTKNDSITKLTDQLYEANYFSLEQNDRAQNYLETISYEELIPLVKEQLMSYNDSPEGNKYVDQTKMGNQKFIINKIKVLNARWIIADFSNGQMWGEVFLKFFVKEDKSIAFETVETFVYPVE